ncbi:MAG TPA: dioxygenase, partial [Stenotrophomonas sp.]|nr:dioxygenase [Stenotrophomonas sp.]
MTRLPSLYISHGSPMTALQPGLVGVRLAELAAQLPRPRAIVMASAHWLTRQ